MRELEFDGWWTGEVEYSCDCCGNVAKLPFDSEEEANNGKDHRRRLSKRGWQFTKVNNQFRDFCSEACRNKYIRENTF